MKELLVILLLLFNFFNAKSQKVCSSIENKMNGKILSELLKKVEYKNYNGQIPMVRLALHNVRSSSGSGGNTWNDIRSVVDGISSFFEPHGICFTVVEEDEILNDIFFNLSGFWLNSNWVDLIQTNTVLNAINIYFVADANSGGIATGFLFDGLGYPTNIPTVTLSNTTQNIITFNSELLAHEIGHCLGLWHTHTTINGVEQIPRVGSLSNCETSGDELCDTPADPNISFNSGVVSDANCQYIGNASLNGFYYEPDTRNVMSYTFPNCMDLFTYEQGQRMRSFILNTGLFDDYVIPFDKVITGTINENEYYGVENDLIASSSLSNNLHILDGNVLFEAGNSITFNSGFHLLSGTNFKAKIKLYSCLDPNIENFAKNNYTYSYLDTTKKQGKFFQNVLYKLYPNPTQGNLRFDLQTEFDANISVAMYDLSGREIKRYVSNENWEQGKHQKEYDISNLSDGVYLFKFCINENCFNEKVVKTK